MYRYESTGVLLVFNVLCPAGLSVCILDASSPYVQVTQGTPVLWLLLRPPPLPLAMASSIP